MKIGDIVIGAIAVIFVVYIVVGAVEFVGVAVRAARKWWAGQRGKRG